MAVVTTNDASERLTATVALTNRFPSARIVLSGGSAHLEKDDGEESEALVARDFLVSLGVAADRMELEDQSRNTIENAAHSLAVAKPQTGDRWLLVTSASHMPRAVASFRAVGFDTIPYPVDFRTQGKPDVLSYQSMSEGLAMARLAAHEWFGLIAYRFAGKTAQLFPEQQ